MSACVVVVIAACMLTVRVTFAACGPDGFATVPADVSVHVVPESEPLYVVEPPVRATVVDGTLPAFVGSAAFWSRESAYDSPVSASPYAFWSACARLAAPWFVVVYVKIAAASADSTMV